MVLLVVNSFVFIGADYETFHVMRLPNDCFSKLIVRRTVCDMSSRLVKVSTSRARYGCFNESTKKSAISAPAYKATSVVNFSGCNIVSTLEHYAHQ